MPQSKKYLGHFIHEFLAWALERDKRSRAVVHSSLQTERSEMANALLEFAPLKGYRINQSYEGNSVVIEITKKT